jgi:hypothetical protein
MKFEVKESVNHSVRIIKLLVPIMYNDIRHRVLESS